MRVAGDDEEGDAAEASFQAMSAVRAGARLALASAAATEIGWTQPPPHLSESELLGLMEEHGVGTDASMAQHVSSIGLGLGVGVGVGVGLGLVRSGRSCAAPRACRAPCRTRSSPPGPG